MKCACDVCGAEAVSPAVYCAWCSLSCFPVVQGKQVELPRHARVLIHAALQKPSKEQILTAVKHAGVKTILDLLRRGRP